MCLTAKYPQIVAINVLTNCGPLSATTTLGIANGNIKWSKKMFAAFVVLFLAVDTIFVNLEYQLDMTVPFFFLYGFWKGCQNTHAW